jgi:hypothetical protein
MSYCALYNKMKKWLDEGQPRDWILSTIQNSRDMKTTYTGARDIMTVMNWLQARCSEECAINEGINDFEGGSYFTVQGGNG